MDRDDQNLRDAVRAWLAAYDALDAAQGGEDYAETLELAERVSLARMRLDRELVGLGWSPPRTGTREGTR